MTGEGGGRDLVLCWDPRLRVRCRECDPLDPGLQDLVRDMNRVMRPGDVTVRYTDLAGQEETLEDDAFLARVVQHEIDHLDGILFIDHLGWWTRLVVHVRMTLRRAGLRI